MLGWKRWVYSGGLHKEITQYYEDIKPVRAFTQRRVGVHTGVHSSPFLQLGLQQVRHCHQPGHGHYHSPQGGAAWRRTCEDARWVWDSARQGTSLPIPLPPSPSGMKVCPPVLWEKLSQLGRTWERLSGWRGPIPHFPRRESQSFTSLTIGHRAMCKPSWGTCHSVLVPILGGECPAEN